MRTITRITLGSLCLVSLLAVTTTSFAAVNVKNRRTTETLVNHPPLQPVNIQPRNGALINELRAGITLVATPFKDPDRPSSQNGRQRFSQWQLFKAGALFFDSGVTSRSRNTFQVRRSVLDTSSSYSWRVRYADGSGDPATMWSAWSKTTSFRLPAAIVKNLTGPAVIATAKPGEPVYADHRFPLILTLPYEVIKVKDNVYLRTRTSDADTSGPGTLISFTSDMGLRVVVAYDDRATTLPQWLWAFGPFKGATPTASSLPMALRSEKMRVSDREAPLRRLLVKEFVAGDLVELGNNLPSPDDVVPTSPSLKMYSVIVLPKVVSLPPIGKKK